MYHVLVETLAHAVLEYIRKHGLLRAGDRVGAAVSGGADSVAMLRVLLELRRELGIVLSVAHFNHQLRGAESDADERFVAELALRHKLELHCERGDVSAHAAAKHLSLEKAARELRYAFFCQLLAAKLNRIATAHTVDDQAETVLLRIVRGSGSRGLAGIYPQLSVAGPDLADGGPASAISHPAASIVRPMLGCRRKVLENYLREIGQDWREDKSNRDLRHARNRVRHGILPRLERNLNPAVREALAETAEIARAEEEYFEQEVAGVVPKSSDEEGSPRTFNLAELRKLPLALQRRVVRAAGELLGLRLEFRHVEEVVGLIADSAGAARSAGLPNGWKAARTRNELRFEATSAGAEAADYEYCLAVPGSVEVPELGSRFEARLVQGNSAEVYNPEHLLNRELLAQELRLRNWRPGDRFWSAHSKAPKKVKELLQERHVSGEERRHWPVVVSGEKLVWLRGFPAPAGLRSKDGAGVVIREFRTGEDPFELGE